MFSIIFVFCCALTVSAQDHEDSVVVYFEQGRTAFYPEYRENGRRCDEFIKRISALQKISSFSKCTDKIKSERLKEIQDAEEEINKSISEIEAQEKLANISYNISNNIIYCEYKEFALCGIWLFVNISLWGVGGMLIILGNEEKSLSITLLAVGVAIFYLSIFFTHGYYNRLARSVYNNYMTSANKHV